MYRFTFLRKILTTIKSKYRKKYAYSKIEQLEIRLEILENILSDHLKKH